MKPNRLLSIALIVITSLFGSAVSFADSARWITTDNADSPNSWIAFRKDVNLKRRPSKAILRIAADSKYWLWINGDLAVFEGSLKRGPRPGDGYYDEIDVAPFLKKGVNKIAVLMWHFGKEGFSHQSSGKAGLIIDSDIADFNTNCSWLCCKHPAYGTCGDPLPNFRLAESNLRFDARDDIPGWQTADCAKQFGFSAAVEAGKWNDKPWGNLDPRPIPMWKDHGIRQADFVRRPAPENRDSVVVRLPYNMQFTPVFTLNDPVGGNTVSINTDHTFDAGAINLRAEYVTRQGRQCYESLGWLSGDYLYLILPRTVQVESVCFRETGYDCSVQGAFDCSDPFYNIFWQKAMRTLYINMRDTWFDCPERERAQWWGDAVVLMGESFYSYSHSVHQLMRKGIHELAAWQKPNGILFTPIPAGNWSQELPGQMLASIGRYGFWTYFMNTADRQTIVDVYPAVKRYLATWSTDETGLTAIHKGEWDWGDWGDNRDMRLIYSGWHYMALEAAANMADMLGLPDDASSYRAMMADVKRGYNKCWNGYAYRHPTYNQCTDDRVQALAVISGIADPDKYDAITNFLADKSNWHASPYMEKYIMEALFVMNHGDIALSRAKTRFDNMINHPDFNTLFELWRSSRQGMDGATVNHAWSGGPITVLAQQMCGIDPVLPGYKVFRVEPKPSGMQHASLTVPSVAGNISSSFSDTADAFTLSLSVPKGSEALVYLPTTNVSHIDAGKLNVAKALDNSAPHSGRTCLRVKAGDYSFTVTK